ncbi:MAG: type II toxin-antitoxin system RelE/ParE family toxin [Thermoanaerobaculia bacterium]
MRRAAHPPSRAQCHSLAVPAPGTTHDVYNGIDSKEARTIPKALWTVACRKLDMLDAAQDLLDPRAPPGNRLEKVKGALAGRFSIRINDQYRIVFSWNHGNVEDVRIEDYH